MTRLTRRLAKLTAVVGVAASFVMSAGAAEAATLSVVDATIPGPIGGSRLCVDTTCRDLRGIANLHIEATLSTTSLGLPLVTVGQQPGCTSNVDVQVNLNSVGTVGTLHTVLEYDVTDRNGNVLSHESVWLPDAVVSASTPSHSVSYCMALL